jgi:hypothetical protein
LINVVVEGDSDSEAAKAIVASTGREVARVIVAGGKARLDPKIAKYNQAARRSSWIVFRDSDGRCPVRLRAELTAKITAWSPNFLLRIAHSMTEAWLLADRDGFADFFRVKVGQIPADSESLPHAKQEVLRLCVSSRSRIIRQDMVRSTGETGPLYVKRINEFASTRWDVSGAAANSDSLSRAIQSIQRLP